MTAPSIDTAQHDGCEIIYESRDGIALITIDRPQARNAINTGVAIGLHAAWQRFAQTDEDRVAVLTSSGERAFSAGADLHDIPKEHFWASVPNLSVPTDKPIIAAVNGFAIGAGATMVMLADMAVASEDASFVFPEARIGAFTGLMGGFPPRMQYKAGLEWLMTGDPMTAQRAYEVGLVNRLAPKAQALTVALEVARKIADNAPLVVRAIKSIARSTLTPSSADRYYLQREMLEGIGRSADRAEGVASAREKRRPRFTGR